MYGGQHANLSRYVAMPQQRPPIFDFVWAKMQQSAHMQRAARKWGQLINVSDPLAYMVPANAEFFTADDIPTYLAVHMSPQEGTAITKRHIDWCVGVFTAGMFDAAWEMMYPNADVSRSYGQRFPVYLYPNPGQPTPIETVQNSSAEISHFCFAPVDCPEMRDTDIKFDGVTVHYRNDGRVYCTADAIPDWMESDKWPVFMLENKDLTLPKAKGRTIASKPPQAADSTVTFDNFQGWASVTNTAVQKEKDTDEVEGDASCDEAVSYVDIKNWKTQPFTLGFSQLIPEVHHGIKGYSYGEHARLALSIVYDNGKGESYELYETDTLPFPSDSFKNFERVGFEHSTLELRFNNEKLTITQPSTGATGEIVYGDNVDYIQLALAFRKKAPRGCTATVEVE
jgi:hypothetical protein